MAEPFTNNCVQCGRNSDLVCKKCKTEVYCSDECQLQHWKAQHKLRCKRKELAGAPCNICGDTEEIIGMCCFKCGFLFCQSCNGHIFYNDEDASEATAVSCVPCPGCEKNMEIVQEHYREHLLKLIEEKTHDPRLARWLILLGYSYHNLGWEENAKEAYKSAGKLGLGEGYCRLADIYLCNHNWDEAKRYYRKAADLHHVGAIHKMSSEAYFGCIDAQEEPKHNPNFEEAFHWVLAGARLGDLDCYAKLARCYSEGIGTEQNLVKSFKWSKRAAKQGCPKSMRRCGECYCNGEGVQKSYEQSIYWFEKSLEIEDHAAVRSILQVLQSLQGLTR